MALKAKHPVYGDTVTMAIQGLVLPRAASADSCERAAAERAGQLIRGALTPGDLGDFVDVRIRPDGGFAAAIRGKDGLFLQVSLGRELPVVALSDDREHRVDWCASPPRASSSQPP
jgi:hypothetical protein